MPDVRSHSHRPLPNALRFPRVATFAAAGYLALATVDFAGEAVRPALQRAEPAAPVTATAGPLAMSAGAVDAGAPTAAVFSPGAFSSSLASPSPAVEPHGNPSLPPAAEPAAHGVASWYGSRFHGLPT